MAPDIAPVHPLELDLETADAMAEVDRASLDAAGLRLPAPVGAARLRAIQLGSDCRPVGGLWLTRDGDRVVGHARVEMPWRENTGTVFVRGTVHPDHRRRGIGRALLRHALDAAERAGRPTVFAGSYEGTDVGTALAALGFGRAARYAIRRVDLHGAGPARWDRLHDEAAASAADYEVVRQVGSTPDERVEGMVALHEAINDAPRDDSGLEDDAWDAARLSDYERARPAGTRRCTG